MKSFKVNYIIDGVLYVVRTEKTPKFIVNHQPISAEAAAKHRGKTVEVTDTKLSSCYVK